MNSFRKEIKIKFNDPFSPFKSMGRIVSFYNYAKEVCAHLSLTWESRLWFAYYSESNSKWIDIFVPQYFSFYTPPDGSHTFSLEIFENKIYIKQNCSIFEFDIEDTFDYESAIYFEDFEDCFKEKEGENIFFDKNNIVSLKDCNLLNDAPFKKKTDIIVIGYKGFEFLDLCLENIFYTFFSSKKDVEIGKIIYCDNNSGENREKSINIVEKYKKHKYGFIEIEVVLNDDDEFCSNRVSATLKALDYLSDDSTTVTILDSDVFMLNCRWLGYYEKFCLFKDLKVVALTVDCMRESFRFRDSICHLPRILPHFCIFEKNFFIEKNREDKNILGDYKEKLRYNNIEFNFSGMHYSKIYLEILSSQSNIYHLDSSSVELIPMYLYSDSSFLRNVIDKDIESVNRKIEKSFMLHFFRGSFFKEDDVKIQNIIDIVDEYIKLGGEDEENLLRIRNTLKGMKNV